MHLHGLTGLRKAACESRLGYLYQYAWSAWTVQECNFNVRLYINWISVVVPIRTVLAETVTYGITSLSIIEAILSVKGHSKIKLILRVQWMP